MVGARKHFVPEDKLDKLRRSAVISNLPKKSED